MNFVELKQKDVEIFQNGLYNRSMPNDMYTLNALSYELAQRLQGGRIEKINQPEKDEVTFYVFAGGKNLILVVSVNPNSPRIHITTEKKDNPYVAPPFLMHLRRRFIGARIEKISCVGYDRVIRFDVIGKNDLSDETSFKIYVELLGRYSNIIVCEDNDVISEALRHITPENSLRCIMPKVKYELPPNAKAAPDVNAKATLDTFGGGDLIKFLSASFAGFSFATATELISRAQLPIFTESLTEEQKNTLVKYLDKFYHVNESELYRPCVRYENDVATDFFIMPYLSSGYEFRYVENLNEAVKICSLEKDRVTRLQNESKVLNAAVKNAIKKYERNLAAARQKLIECEDLDKMRLYGDLITNSFYLLKKGDVVLKTVNYYDGSAVTITLDPLLTPQQNAQNYYKKYAKQKRTVSVCEKQVVDLTKCLDNLYSVKTSLDLAENPAELVEIKEELIDMGLIKEKPQKGKVRKPKLLPPKEYIADGFTIIRGRSNIENDRLTFGVAQENDIWFHAKESHGSHVILKTEGKKPTDKAIQVACELAAYYSEKQQSGSAIVDYTLRKYVKRRPNAVKGAVIYTDYKSAVVEPQNHKNEEKGS